MSGKVAAFVVAAGALASGVGASSGTGDAQFLPVGASSDLAVAMAHSAAPRTADIKTVHADVQPAYEAAKLVRSEGFFVRQHIDMAIKHAADSYTARQAELKRLKDAEDAEKARIAAEEAEKARVAAEQAQAQQAPPAVKQAPAPAPAPAAAPRVSAAKPAEGSFTSGFGARWGTTHYGVDIANSIGTPILSAMDGVIVEAGPASGFGLWVRVRHNDGTITVYGHVNEILVSQGQQVHAGQQIATMGNRGQSTGPHLHFEVWIGGSQKIDPVGWLGARGISL
ncbi:M23 family metallopeptidase [Saccharothrix hoggarensis]|uniref:M23 family metallopeptidase n=1 Tax=Saccharothrix hoggarensis TaxID=913853 RepID=A0ABW3R007_9PSEU